MHDALVTLKDGSTLCGPIWAWTPRAGTFSITDAEKGLVDVNLRDVTTASHRVRRTTAGEEDVDLVARARNEGWDGT